MNMRTELMRPRFSDLLLPLGRIVALLALFAFGVYDTNAKLIVKVDEPKQTGQKAVIKLTMKNTFKVKIEAARAQIFLVDDQNKTSSPGARWIIGGDKDRPPLAPGATTTYNFVVTTDKESKIKDVVFSKIVLEGGKEADANKDVTIEK
jgi:hypothetical protein